MPAMNTQTNYLMPSPGRDILQFYKCQGAEAQIERPVELEDR